MSTDSSIQWTDSTWNPIAGCSIVSPGCAHCYAMNMASRLESMGQEKYSGTTKKVNGLSVWTGKINLDDEALKLPLSWKKPKRIFVNSMSDLFHPEVPFEFVDKVFSVMALCPQHIFQVLTKRPERMAEYTNSRIALGDMPTIGATQKWYRQITNWLDDSYGGGRFFETEKQWDSAHAAIESVDVMQTLSNVWLGTSVEQQSVSKHRIKSLLECRSAIKFLSCEPLLDSLNLYYDGAFGGVDWVIVGGESGPRARSCDVRWVKSIVEDCRNYHCACFVKQLGAKPCEGKNPIPLKDSHGGDISEWPEHLRVRQFPKIAERASQ